MISLSPTPSFCKLGHHDHDTKTISKETIKNNIINSSRMSGSRRRPSGRVSSNTVRTPSGTSLHADNQSTIQKKVPGVGDPWAWMLFCFAVSSFFAFGLFTFFVARMREREMVSFMQEHWDTRDCNGPFLVIEARKPTAMLISQLPYLGPSLALSFALAFLYIGTIFLIRQLNSTQWIAGSSALFGAIGTILLVKFSSYQACVASLVFGVSSLISIATWHDSRHISKTIVQLIFDITKASPVLYALSAIAGIAIIACSGFFIVLLYNLKRIWDYSYPSCTSDRDVWIAGLATTIVISSISLYWITLTISSFAQTVAAAVARNYFQNVQPTMGHSADRRCSIGRTLKYSSGSVCFGSGLLALSLFLKDLMLGSMQVSFVPAAAFKAITAALLMSLITYMAPLYLTLDSKINDWGFTIIAIDGTAYWKSNKVGMATMSSFRLNDVVNETGLSSTFNYIPIAVGGISSIATYMMVSTAHGPILQTQDKLTADVLIAFAFLAGLQIARAILAPFKGVMCTIWVMMARYPTRFKASYGNIWDSLVVFNPTLAYGLVNRD